MRDGKRPSAEELAAAHHGRLRAKQAERRKHDLVRARLAEGGINPLWGRQANPGEGAFGGDWQDMLKGWKPGGDGT